MKRFTQLFWLFALLAAPAVLRADDGGWPQPKGMGYFKISQNMIRARQFFDPGGNLIDITTTAVYSSNIYGEMGITDRLTGVLSVPLFIRSTINNRESTINGAVEPGDAFQSWGDVRLGLKYGLLTEGPIVLSAAATVSLPTGENVGGNSELLQSGSGAFEHQYTLEAAHSFYPRPFYASVLAGYNFRGTADFDYRSGTDGVDYQDQFVWGGEIGYTHSAFFLALKWQQVISIDNGEAGGITGSSSIFGNGVSFFSLTPEVNLKLSETFGISASSGFALSGENILGAPNWSLGVYFISGK